MAAAPVPCLRDNAAVFVSERSFLFLRTGDTERAEIGVFFEIDQDRL